MTKSGYIVKVNDEDLTGFKKEQKGAELAISLGFEKVSNINLSKLNGRAKSLTIGSVRYQ